MKSREFWVFLFFLGLFLFNWPFLDIFSLVLPHYLLVAWTLFILVLCVVSTLKEKEGRDTDV